VRGRLTDHTPRRVYDLLFGRYGGLGWWPANSPYEVIVGAVLTQNTAWSNVEKAISNFGGKLSPEYVRNADMAALSDIVRPAGFFKQKAGYLKNVTEWFYRYGCGVPAVQRENLEKLRPELLSVKGIGRETADSILLYAFGFPTFVVDAYTLRLCERLPMDAGKNYEEVKRFFEQNLPESADIFNNFHAAIVINGKKHCKSKPVCAGCPLSDACKKTGIREI